MNLLSQLQPRKANAIQQSIARHDAFIGAYVEAMSVQPAPEACEREVTVIARSPASPVVRAVMARGDDLRRCGARVKMIFAELGAEGQIAECAESLEGLHTGAGARESLRWARMACLMDAHEQLILGTAMCWSGDCMRREAGKVDALDLFERNAPKSVRLGMLAFDAIWAICELVPTSRFRSAPAKAAALRTPDLEDGLSALSFLRKSERAGQIAH